MLKVISVKHSVKDKEIILPSFSQMAQNLIGAVKDVVIDGIERRTQEEIDAALKTCEACEFFIANEWGGRCGKCGCKTSFKVKLLAWKCPLGKW